MSTPTTNSGSPAPRPPIAPATPPGPTTPPPLGRVLFLCVVWWGVIVAHFFICGRVAYAFGHPDLIPSWLVPIDEILQHAISAAVDLFLLVLWWVLVGLLFVPGWYLADLVNRLTTLGAPAEKPADSKKPTPQEAALIEALFALVPVLVMTLLSLAILPAEAPNHYEFESGMEMAEQLTYASFVEYQYLSIIAMLVIFALGAGFCLGVWFVMTVYPDAGIGAFFMVILFSIAVAMGAGLGLGPLLSELPERFGVYRASAMLLGGTAIALSPPTLLILRRIDQKPSA